MYFKILLKKNKEVQRGREGSSGSEGINHPGIIIGSGTNRLSI